MIRKRLLLACGTAMACVYGLTLAVACILNPGFDLLHHAPSELGQATAAHPLVYNFGMMLTGLAGLLAGAGIIAARTAGRGAVWDISAGVSVLLAALGVTMAGVFPLPDQLHYGFGLTTAAVLTPALGAVSLWRAAQRFAAAILILAFLLIIGFVASGAPALAPGALMFITIACLCRSASRRLASLPG